MRNSPIKLNTLTKPGCAVNGMIRPGAMCGQVIVGGKLCGYAGECDHQIIESHHETELSAKDGTE